MTTMTTTTTTTKTAAEEERRARRERKKKVLRNSRFEFVANHVCVCSARRVVSSRDRVVPYRTTRQASHKHRQNSSRNSNSNNTTYIAQYQLLKLSSRRTSNAIHQKHVHIAWRVEHAIYAFLFCHHRSFRPSAFNFRKTFPFHSPHYPYPISWSLIPTPPPFIPAPHFTLLP